MRVAVRVWSGVKEEVKDRFAVTGGSMSWVEGGCLGRMCGFERVLERRGRAAVTLMLGI